MKTGQIIMSYADPLEQTHPIGKVLLISLIKDYILLERWKVTYVDGPANECEILIKKQEHKVLK